MDEPLEFSFNSHLDLASALAAGGRQVLLETVLAVQIALLLNESNVLQRTTAVAVHADEMIRAPDAAQCRDKGSSVNVRKQEISLEI